MRNVGVDLSVNPRQTGVVHVDWTPDGSGVVESAVSGATDAQLLAIFNDDTVDVVGIDAPLGWPDGFVAAVTAHHGFRPWPGDKAQEWADAYTGLRLRVTDRWVKQQLPGISPISVSADKIGAPAMRAAWLLGLIETG